MGGTKALKQQLGAFLKAKQDKEKGGVTKVDKKLQKKKKKQAEKIVKRAVETDQVLIKRKALENNLRYLQRTVKFQERSRDVIEKLLPAPKGSCDLKEEEDDFSL